MEKLISIIIATYNAGETVAKCLDSIIPQKTVQTELLIVDGGSCDNTIQIIREREDNIDYFISEPDNGIYDAWNKGIKISKGEWIMFIGADDLLKPDAIINCLDVLRKTKNINKIDYVCFKDDMVGYDGNYLRKLGKEPKWSHMKYNMMAAHVASLHNKKNLFEKVGLYDLRYSICADYELLLRKREKLNYLYLPQYTMAEMREGGMSTTWKAVFETYKIRRYHHTINPFCNLLELVKSLMCYKLYKYHK